MTLSRRAEMAYGSGDLETLFNGSPMTVPPFPPAIQRKDREAYDSDAVKQAIGSHQKTEPVDVRELYSTQPGITRDGVSHYMKSGDLYKDVNQAGNQHPVVYDREGKKLLLSGTHRATAALLRGDQFNAVVVHGGWGKKRK